ncbi:translation initiation factor IF-2 [bacterium]|nr:translation initiation factor IF-2 [bacterium]
MAKVRVFQLAKEMGLQTEALLAALAKLGVENVTKASAIDDETATALRDIIGEQAAKVKAAEEAKVAEAAAAKEAAAPAAAPAAKRGRGKAAPAEAPAPEGEAATAPPMTEEEKKEREREEREKKEREGRLPGGPPRLHEGLMELEEHLAAMQGRAGEEEEAPLVKPIPDMARRPSGDRPEWAIDVPPVVTVLGHIDHGKTSLLDALRNTQIAAGEAGGITQHIGASEISHDGKPIVFLDTPGHAAFTAMRARGAQVTDIAIIIVAADDGIMPQTVEAINHAKAAQVPIVVAINKVDLPDANVDRVKQQLLEHELVPEEWGGSTIVVPISARTGEGLDNLMEMLHIVAEVQELWADPNADLAGIIVEAQLDQSQGPVATVLVRNGRLSVGDVVVCGTAYGRVRRLRNWLGKTIKTVEPGHPASVIGLSDVPESGDVMIRVATPKEARVMAEQNALVLREHQAIGAQGAALRELYHTLQGGQIKDLNVIIKADAYGSAQALESSLLQLNEELEEVKINVIHVGVGAVSESDVLLATASKAIVVGFHVEADASVLQAAASEGVEVRTYRIIYQVLDDFRAAAFGMLEPLIETQYLGKAEVLQIFRISRVGVVAGSRVTDGEMRPNADIVVTRDGEEVYRGKLTSLRHFNQDVSVMQAPAECGLAATDFRGWKVGDKVEATMQVTVERKLQPVS